MHLRKNSDGKLDKSKLRTGSMPNLINKGALFNHSLVIMGCLNSNVCFVSAGKDELDTRMSVTGVYESMNLSHSSKKISIHQVRPSQTN